MKIIIFLLWSIFAYGHLFAQGSDCCEREAVVYCDYYQAFQGTDANEAVQEEFCNSVKAKLTQLFTRDCFRLIEAGPLDAANLAENEYHFEIKYVGITNYSGPPTPRLTLNLNFNNESYSELVHYWEVEESGEGLKADETIWPKLLNTLEQHINAGPDIIEIIEKFEKRPVDLEIGMDKEVLDPGEEIDIFLTGFTDERGETSREFNRIIVHADEGEILNGAVCDIGPEYIAFKVNGNFIRIRYKAPDNCENSSDKITIYKSCDVLPESILFMNRTEKKDRLIEKELSINCSDATLVLKKKVVKKVVYNKEESKPVDNCTENTKEKRQFNETIESSIRVTLKLIESTDMPMYNQRWEYYEPINVNLSSFNLLSNDKRYNYGNLTGHECAVGGYETTTTIKKQLKKKEIEGMDIITSLPWIVTFDNETGKALKIIPAGYGVAYEFDQNEIMKSRTWTKDGGSNDSENDTKARRATFAFGPVEDPKPDPTAKSSSTWIQDYIEKEMGEDMPIDIASMIPEMDSKEVQNDINPDVIVQFGDGKKYFGGNGRKFETERNPYGFEQIEETYSWQMTRKRRNQ